jgi:ElaB/YqjD/DUF883 family membrane-anchored ribosome-binding protein
MSVNERTDRVLDRAARGDADIGEIEECISATRADLDRNLSAMEQRLSKDELINQAVDYLRSGPTDFLSNFGQAVKANPIPATLMTVSLAWLIFGGRRASGNGADGQRAYRGDGWGDDDYAEEAAGIGEDESIAGPGPIRRVTETLRERASRLGDHASQVADRGSHLADRAHSASDRVGRKFNEMGGKMTDASRRAQEVFQTARERVAQARESLAQQPKRLQSGYQDLTENHPLVLGAIAFVAGAAVAATLRRTQIENEMMGEYRDEAFEEAERRARSGLNRGVETAKSALTRSGEDESPDNQMEMEVDGSSRDRDMTHRSESSSSPDTPASQSEGQDRFH